MTGDRRAAPPAERGPRIVLSDHQALGRAQTLTIFAFIVVAFVLLAYRTEQNTNRIDQNVFDACEARAIITETTPDCEGLR